MEEKKQVTESVRNAFAEEVISHILAITFTDAAAAEMRGRIAGGLLEKGIEVDPAKIPAMTFNALYMNVIREFAEEVGLRKEGISVIDANPTAIAAKLEPLVTGENQVSDLNYGIEVSSDWGVIPITMKFFSLVKEEGIDLDAPGIVDELADKARRISKDLTRAAITELLDRYVRYEEILKEENMITFAEQEVLAMQLLDAHPDYLETLDVHHLIVDEFQDSNDANMELVRKFAACKTLKSLFVIGDDDQSIYGFRNANPENMTDFEEKMSGFTVNKLKLSNNYRSYSEILEPAFDFVDQNQVRIAKHVNAAKGTGGSYELQGYGSADEEYERIAEEVKVALAAGKTVAVEARTKKILRKVSVVLAKENIPWVNKAPIKVLENAKVKAVMGLCDGFFEPDADMGYITYLVAKYTDEGYRQMDPEDIEEEKNEIKRSFNNFILLDPGFQMTKFKELVDALGDADEIFNKWKNDLYQCEDLPSMIKFITDYRRYGGSAEMKMDSNYDGYVDLITCHSAKGLEWDHICLTLDDFYTKRLELSRNYDDLEEERRLIFVAMTRAKERLFVTGSYVAWSTEEDGNVYNAFLRELYAMRDKRMDEANADDTSYIPKHYLIGTRNCSQTFDDEVTEYKKAKAEAERRRKRSAEKKAHEKKTYPTRKSTSSDQVKGQISIMDYDPFV